ncbi:hypothetical protein K2Q00_01965 [Patescibacteria group bacterium]|nr:hypothetical protein [Patescibacteria group bacterium]
MAGLFSKQAPMGIGKTVLLVDIENGSVGCALVHLPSLKLRQASLSTGKELPKLFAETRVALPMMRTLDLEKLMKETDTALREALTHTSVTAARMRTHAKLSHIGAIHSSAVFISAPWTAARTQNGELDWEIESELQSHISRAIADTFGDIAISFYATSAAVAHATGHLFETAPHLLLTTMTGEVTELSVLEDGKLTARATIPFGKHFFLRTLSSHAGLSYPEAHSALRLARGSNIETPVEEALYAAGTQFASNFATAAQELHADNSPHGILVVAQEPMGEWLVQMLVGQEALTKSFSQGTTVQALHTHHVMPYLSAHAAKPDIVFMVEALFINRMI